MELIWVPMNCSSSSLLWLLVPHQLFWKLIFVSAAIKFRYTACGVLSTIRLKFTMKFWLLLE